MSLIKYALMTSSLGRCGSLIFSIYQNIATTQASRSTKLMTRVLIDRLRKAPTHARVLHDLIIVHRAELLEQPVGYSNRSSPSIGATVHLQFSQSRLLTVLSEPTLCAGIAPADRHILQLVQGPLVDRPVLLVLLVVVIVVTSRVRLVGLEHALITAGLEGLVGALGDSGQ